MFKTFLVNVNLGYRAITTFFNAADILDAGGDETSFELCLTSFTTFKGF